MRKLYCIALMLVSLPAWSQTSEKSYFAKEQITEAYFQSLDLEVFTGKTGTVFLQQLPDGALSKELLTEGVKNGYAGMLRISYPDGLMVYLYVQAFRYANPNGISRRKKLRRFEKETVATIRIHNGLACINGCD